MYNSIQAIDSHSMCEVCGNGGHSGNDFPKPVKTLPSSTATTTGYIHKEAKGGTSRAHHIKEVITTTQISIQTNPP
jgi:hypothetical protein